MKGNYFIMLLALILVLSGCRQEALNLEQEHSHGKQSPYVSFGKFSKLTQINKQSFFHSVNAKGISDLEDYNIDTINIRQTLRNNTATAFSFRIQPKNTPLLQNNIFYNLAYVKSGAEWKRYIVKYEADDPDFLLHVALNPSVSFKGTTSIVSGADNTSRLYTCIVTMQKYRQNCPQGHAVIEQCYQESPNCCRTCWYYVDYSIMGTCDDGGIPGGGPINSPTGSTDAGAEGFEVNYTEIDSAELDSFKNNSAFGNKYKLWFNNPENQSAGLQLFLYYQYNNYKSGIFESIKKYIDFAILGKNTAFADINIEWVTNLLLDKPDITWEQFQNWFLNGYNTSYINKLTLLSTEELQEFVNINKEIDISPYEEENVKEANEIYVAITAQADLSSMNETDVETVLSQCCPNLIVVPQALISEKTKVIALNYKNLRRLYPNWSKGKCLWEASRDTVQLLLDIGGTFPLIGEVCDLTNGSIYAMNGDALNAALSYSAAIPLAGWGATVSKYAVKVVHLANGAKTSLKFIRRLDGFVTFGNRGQLRKVLGMIKGDARQAHHIIPWELYDSPAIQKAALSSNAFHLNEALNGIPLNNAVHYGSHGNYNSLVKQRLDAIPSNYTPNQVYNEVMDIIQDIRTAINNHPNTPINQLVF